MTKGLEQDMTICYSVLGRFVPGCYTLAVSEALPEEFQVHFDDCVLQLLFPCIWDTLVSGFSPACKCFEYE